MPSDVCADFVELLELGLSRARKPVQQGRHLRHGSFEGQSAAGGRQRGGVAESGWECVSLFDGMSCAFRSGGCSHAMGVTGG